MEGFSDHQSVEQYMSQVTLALGLDIAVGMSVCVCVGGP